jgi:aspartyl-tRNA(Asn)/glutamyl-tRNA(Gln) amidotransferase subunit B
MAAYFEETAKASGQAKLASNWIMGEVSALLNKQQIEITDAVVPSAIVLAKLISKIVNGAISNASGKTLFQEICLSTGLNHLDEARINLTLDEMIEAKGLKQMNDTGALEVIIDEVLAANPKNVEEFKAGNAKALNGLVGPIMKASKGKANPAQVNALLLKKLG